LIVFPTGYPRICYIWEAVTKSKETSGDSSLCWAADRLLLDIIIDEFDCKKELFSNIMNTYHRFETRRMLYAHPAFTIHAGLELDGLAKDAYKGAVYGNPPFDGRNNDKNTINKTLDKAQSIARQQDNFRAIYFIPLTKYKLAQRCKNKNTELIMKFPNNTVPFIPDNHWYGGNNKAG
jgi:hypothetical protein